MGSEKCVWTDELDEQLVNEVASMPILWYPSHPDYFYMYKSQQAWNILGARLGGPITGSLARDRFSGIRSTFQLHDWKLNCSLRSTSGDVYQPEWPLFPKLSFLRGGFHQESRPTNALAVGTSEQPRATQNMHGQGSSFDGITLQSSIEPTEETEVDSSTCDKSDCSIKRRKRNGNNAPPKEDLLMVLADACKEEMKDPVTAFRVFLHSRLRNTPKKTRKRSKRSF